MRWTPPTSTATNPDLLPQVNAWVANQFMSSKLRKIKAELMASSRLLTPFWIQPQTRLATAFAYKAQQQKMPSLSVSPPGPAIRHYEELVSRNAKLSNPVAMPPQASGMDTHQLVDIELALLRKNLECKHNRISLPVSKLMPSNYRMARTLENVILESETTTNHIVPPFVKAATIVGLVGASSIAAVSTFVTGDIPEFVYAIPCANFCLAALTDAHGPILAFSQMASPTWDQVFQQKTMADAVLCGLISELEYHKFEVYKLQIKPDFLAWAPSDALYFAINTLTDNATESLCTVLNDMHTHNQDMAERLSSFVCNS